MAQLGYPCSKMVVEKVMKWFRCQYSTFPHNTLSLIKHLEWSSGQCLPFAQKIMSSTATISTCLINSSIHYCRKSIPSVPSVTNDGIRRGLVAAASLNVSGGDHLICKTINHVHVIACYAIVLSLTSMTGQIDVTDDHCICLKIINKSRAYVGKHLIHDIN